MCIQLVQLKVVHNKLRDTVLLFKVIYCLPSLLLITIYFSFILSTFGPWPFGCSKNEDLGQLFCGLGSRSWFSDF